MKPSSGCLRHPYYSCTRTSCPLLTRETLARVLEAAIFFMYTHTLFDVSGKDEGAFTIASFANPVFSFDVMQLYILADYLDMQELSDLLQELFFGTGALFRQVI